MTTKVITLPIQVVKIALLDEQIRGALGSKFSGLNSASDGFPRAIVDNAITDGELAQMISICQAHNPAQKSSAETNAEAAAADKSAVTTAAAAMISEIDTDIAAIPTADLAALRGILTRSLQREKKQIKGLVRLL